MDDGVELQLEIIGETVSQQISINYPKRVCVCVIFFVDIHQLLTLFIFSAGLMIHSRKSTRQEIL